MSARIVGLINTLNEARNIRYSLGSLLPWCDEVIVVDQDSEDGTADICRSMGARVVTYPRTGFVEAARAFGVKEASTQASADWLLILDADEMVRPALGRYLREAVDGAAAEADADVFLVPRANVIFGRRMDHGKNWPSRRPRFFRPEAIEISERIHRGLAPRSGAQVRLVPARLPLAIWHFSYPDAETLVGKMNRYTSVEARQTLERGKRPARSRNLFGRPARLFWAHYIRDRGYRDGTGGLILAISRAFSGFLLVAKMWELPRMTEREASVRRVREQLLAEHLRADGSADHAPTGSADAT